MVALSIVAAEPVVADHCKGKHRDDPGCVAAGTTLGDLSCTTDQIARFDGTNWVCDVDATLDQTGIEALGFVTGPHTLDTDTSAADCTDGEYLDGDGTCKTASTVSAADFDLLMTKIDNLALLQASGASAYVFVTDGIFTGNLGGVAGADDKCQIAADAAGLPGVYKAWIAGTDPLSAPATRFTQAPSAYILPPGVAPGALGQVADDWADLTDGTIDQLIDVSELGFMINNGVLTNVAADGSQKSSDPLRSCQDWTWEGGEEFGLPFIGLTTSTTESWTDAGDTCCSGGCSVGNPIWALYCFGQ